MLRRLFDSLYNKLLSRLGLALLALALLVNISALIAVDEGVDRAGMARAAAVHSRHVTTEILGVQSMLYEAESAQRGFLYSGDNAYLKPLNDNEGQITTRLVKLRGMVTDSPPQQKRLERVHKIALEKIVELNKSIAIQKMGQSSAAHALVMRGEGKQLMEELNAEITRFLAYEEQVLQGRIEKGARIQLAIRWGFAIILFINALMILAGAVAIMRAMAREMDRDRADLVQQGERDAAAVVQQDKRDAEELVRRDEREAISASDAVQRAIELRAFSGHLLRVQEEERRTIARELHDELGGTLSAVKMDILMGRDAAAKRSDEKSVARLQRALSSIDSGIQFIRRLIEDLRPTLLDNLGFEAALRAMTAQFIERCSVKCVISLPSGELNLTSTQSSALYRICQEALTNVLKYAKATQVTITLVSDGSHWTLTIADDGVGLDATKQHRLVSHGLLGMRERIVALGGNFDIRGPAGRGTTLTATFPVIEHEAVAA